MPARVAEADRGRVTGPDLSRGRGLHFDPVRFRGREKRRFISPYLLVIPILGTYLLWTGFSTTKNVFGTALPKVEVV